MNVMDNETFRMFSNFFGVCAYALTTSVQSYWGNLNVYAMSYVRKSTGSDSGIHTPWIISLLYIGWSVTMALAGYIADILGQKWTIVLGSCFLQAGMLSGYFLIQYSLTAFNFTFGLLAGFGSGLLNCIGLQSIISYKPKHPGILTSFVPSSIALGAIVLNQIITLYINPDNLTPDFSTSQEDFFTQPEILNRVPSVFLVIGGLNLCCHVIAILLLKPKEGKRDFRINKDISRDNKDNEDNEDNEEEQGMFEEETHEKQRMKEISNSVASTQMRQNNPNVLSQLKPIDILTTKTFYVVWLAMGISDFTCVVYLNYYKTSGQLWIHDDHFMAALASSMSLVMAIVRLLWGLITEKCGVKYLIICLSGGLSVMLNLWYFAPMAGRWFYFVWTVVIGCFTAGVYIVFPMATLRLFGSDHFSHNVGMVMSSRIFTNAAAPLLMEFIVTGYGYFYLFLTVGCCDVVVMIFMISFLPRS